MNHQCLLQLLCDLRETASWFAHSPACQRIVALCDRADLPGAVEAVYSALALKDIERTKKLRSLLEVWIDQAQPLMEKK